MTMCPRCAQRPSRLPAKKHGTAPLCQPCFELTQREQARYNTEWQRAHRYANVRRESRCHDDISPEQIERTYQAALKRIKARGLGR